MGLFQYIVFPVVTASPWRGASPACTLAWRSSRLGSSPCGLQGKAGPAIQRGHVVCLVLEFRGRNSPKADQGEELRVTTHTDHSPFGLEEWQPCAQVSSQVCLQPERGQDVLSGVFGSVRPGPVLTGVHWPRTRRLTTPSDPRGRWDVRGCLPLLIPPCPLSQHKSCLKPALS